ncbi:MAG TPA: hypothetical protein VMX13_10785 [Sedimentisphaerales bacterium]|jgi:hypothetical protein|nr:hypothetical protein [Sedimentisphaerales bacterium]
MQVEGVNPGHAYGWQKVQDEEEQIDQTTEPQTTEAVEEPEGDQPDGQRGVIRLLQEGHFKGVSDLRLRINFFDEIAGIEAAQVRTVTAENASAAVASVGAVVESFLAGNELSEDQSTAVSDAQQAFEQAVSDAEDKTQALNNAFAALVTALQTLFTPPTEPEEEPPPPDAEAQAAGESSEQTIEGTTEEPPAEPPAEPPQEPAADAGPDWLAFIENLQAAFDAAMQQLNNAVNSTAALPPLSEPTGNGVAYDKFLAIYNQMRGIEPPGQDLDQTEPPEPET